MKNFFIVTITDVKGIKSFRLNEKIKKIFSIIGVSVSVYFVISIIGILFLGASYLRNSTILSQNRELKTFKENYELEQKLEKERDSKKVDINHLNEVSKVKKERILHMIPNSFPLDPSTRITSEFGSRVHPIAGVVKDHKGLDFGAGLDALALDRGDAWICRLVFGDAAGGRVLRGVQAGGEGLSGDIRGSVCAGCGRADCESHAAFRAFESGVWAGGSLGDHEVSLPGEESAGDGAGFAVRGVAGHSGFDFCAFV